ncbi:MAG: DUF2304 domain-containing protein, partial [Planctomycetia bacterium]|nr:DUF2304 domain-containing protein [Planctomycetia bacterium]
MIAEEAMPLVRRLVPLVFAVAVSLATIEMIRRRKLREEYAILWLCASAGLMLLAIFPGILAWLQAVLKVNYLTIVVLACFLFLALISLHQAAVISRQAEDIRQIAERLALLQQEVREGEKDRRDDGESPAEGV